MKNQIRHIPSWIQTLKPKSNTHPDDKFSKTTQVNNKQRTKNQTSKRGKKNESFTWGKRVVESPSWFAENEEQESNAKSMPKQINVCICKRQNLPTTRSGEERERDDEERQSGRESVRLCGLGGFFFFLLLIFFFIIIIILNMGRVGTTRLTSAYEEPGMTRNIWIG